MEIKIGNIFESSAKTLDKYEKKDDKKDEN